MILDEIIKYKKIEIENRKKDKSLRILDKQIGKNKKPKLFLKKSKHIQLIAELKKSSPSKGIIRHDFEPISLARTCEDAGASALSVLTEERFFQGNIDYISQIKKEVGLPLLRKDFIIDEYQIVESRAYGADAILLIANILKPKIISKFLDLSNEFGMSSLIEVHNRDELKMVLDLDSKIIGINNRDLGTFITDISATEELIVDIPSDKIIVSESGILNRKDVVYLEELGVNAMLVGEAIMFQKDVKSKIAELLGNG